MRVFLDTNVLLDYLLKREPYSSSFFPEAALRATVLFVRLMFPAIAVMKSA